jgi:hypothetical protein
MHCTGATRGGREKPPRLDFNSCTGRGKVTRVGLSIPDRQAPQERVCTIASSSRSHAAQSVLVAVPASCRATIAARGYRAVFQYTEGAARLESPKPLRVSRKGILHAPSLGGNRGSLSPGPRLDAQPEKSGPARPFTWCCFHPRLGRAHPLGRNAHCRRQAETLLERPVFETTRAGRRGEAVIDKGSERLREKKRRATTSRSHPPASSLTAVTSTVTSTTRSGS